jgi:hypothetical protein
LICFASNGQKHGTEAGETAGDNCQQRGTAILAFHPVYFGKKTRHIRLGIQPGISVIYCQ